MNKKKISTFNRFNKCNKQNKKKISTFYRFNKWNKKTIRSFLKLSN